MAIRCASKMMILRVNLITGATWSMILGVGFLGGIGFMRGNRVERIYREVRVNAIGGGSEEIMRDLATRQYGL